MAAKSEETSSLRQTAYRRFKDALFSGRIKPGDFLSQREIVDLVDVPLGPVREALKSLENEGIATLLPKRGIRIIQVDLDGFAKAIEARRIIEGKAAAHFAENAPMSEIEDIKAKTRAFFKDFENGAEMTDALFAEKNRIDFMLHDAIIAFLGNPILSAAFRQATEHVRIFRLNIAANQNFFDLPAIEEHIVILEAMKARDGAAARAAMEAHLSGTFKRAMPSFET